VDPEEPRRRAGRYYTPPHTAEARQGQSDWTRLVWKGIERKAHEQQRPTRRGERILDRQPTFQDFVVNLSRGLETRQADFFDEAIKSGFDEDVAIADLLASLDEEPTKSKADWTGWPTYIEKSAPRPGDVVLESGTNLSRAIRRGIAKALR